jgi:hypothetical protein
LRKKNVDPERQFKRNRGANDPIVNNPNKTVHTRFLESRGSAAVPDRRDASFGFFVLQGVFAMPRLGCWDLMIWTTGTIRAKPLTPHPIAKLVRNEEGAGMPE